MKYGTGMRLSEVNQRFGILDRNNLLFYKKIAQIRIGFSRTIIGI